MAGNMRLLAVLCLISLCLSASGRAAAVAPIDLDAHRSAALEAFVPSDGSFGGSVFVISYSAGRRLILCELFANSTWSARIESECEWIVESAYHFLLSLFCPNFSLPWRNQLTSILGFLIRWNEICGTERDVWFVIDNISIDPPLSWYFRDFSFVVTFLYSYQPRDGWSDLFPLSSFPPPHYHSQFDPNCNTCNHHNDKTDMEECSVMKFPQTICNVFFATQFSLCDYRLLDL